MWYAVPWHAARPARVEGRLRCSAIVLQLFWLLGQGFPTCNERFLQINEWILDPLQKQRDIASKPVTGFSPFLEQFLESNYPIPGKTY